MRHPEGLDSDAFDCSLALLDRLMKMSGDNNDSRGGCRHVVAMVIRSTLCAHDIAQAMPCHEFGTCFHDYANITLTPCILPVYCVYQSQLLQRLLGFVLAWSAPCCRVVLAFEAMASDYTSKI